MRSNAVSQCQTTEVIASRISASPQITSWCVVPSRPTTRRCSAVSSKDGSAKRIENVSSGLLSTALMDAPMTDESSPPLK